jgi:hypothetical protein
MAAGSAAEPTLLTAGSGQQMTVPPGFVVELVASEPEIVNSIDRNLTQFTGPAPKVRASAIEWLLANK